MKKLKLIFLITLFAFTSNVSWADYNKGWNAHLRGDWTTALQEWKPLAEQGDARAQNSLGWLYSNGYGVSQNEKTAIKWYRLSAKQNWSKAQFNLGVNYEYGYGVPQDYKTSFKWYTLAAEHGYAPAQRRRYTMSATVFLTDLVACYNTIIKNNNNISCANNLIEWMEIPGDPYWSQSDGRKAMNKLGITQEEVERATYYIALAPSRGEISREIKELNEALNELSNIFN
jgi:TPR repeat protein